MRKKAAKAETMPQMYSLILPAAFPSGPNRRHMLSTLCVIDGGSPGNFGNLFVARLQSLTAPIDTPVQTAMGQGKTLSVRCRDHGRGSCSRDSMLRREEPRTATRLPTNEVRVGP